MSLEPPSPAAMRRDYTERGALLEEDLAGDWVTQFGAWFAEAAAFGLPEPNAMVVATAGGDGHPSARTVLLKEYDERGFTFFTNYESRKGGELAANPYASLVFPWFPMQRQVIVVGAAERVTRAETEEYFAGRPRGSQLGAWASPQSTVLAGRAAVDAGLAAAEERFGDGPVPAPPHWGGLRVVPETVEFWQGRSSRLHDRLRFRRAGEGRAGEGRAGEGRAGEGRAGEGRAGEGRAAERRTGDGVWVVERLAP